jgi:hypothetical protein
VVRGTLRRDGSRLICGVTSIEVVASDRDRLDRAVAELTPKDFESRRNWAAWAERRARDFKDNALARRAREIDSDALRIKADMRRVAVDAPQEWLAMAKDAKARDVAEPEPSAQAHRAFRAMLASAPAADLKSLLREIEGFFPEAQNDRASGTTDLARWAAPYGTDPAGAYRTAARDIRKALDRKLWGDALEQVLETEASQSIQSALGAADQAAARLQERPELAARLTRKGLEQGRRNLPNMRLDDVKAMARVYRDRLHQPNEALAFLRDWLKAKQDRLSDTDAEGPLSLAVLYEELLDDRASSIDLLRKASKIDPSSKEIAEAFRVRGYRQVKDDWVLSVQQEGPKPTGSTAPAPGESGRQGLKGLTADEVAARIGGKPDRVNYIGSKGQMIEQWIYYLDTKQCRFVNLLHSPGETKPRVVADYSLPLPRNNFKDGAGSAR